MPHRTRGTGKIFTDIILLLIAENPTYGYKIAENFDQFNISFPKELGQKGKIYRVLALLEENGLITFSWDNSTVPARKVYTVTPEGKEYLIHSAIWAKERITVFEKFIERVHKIIKN